MAQSYYLLIHGKFWHFNFFSALGNSLRLSLEVLEVNLESGTLWLSLDQCSENCWVVKLTRLPSAYQGPWKLAQVLNCGCRSSDNVPVIRASRLPSGDPGTWDLSWRRSSQASLLFFCGTQLSLKCCGLSSYLCGTVCEMWSSRVSVSRACWP